MLSRYKFIKVVAEYPVACHGDECVSQKVGLDRRASCNGRPGGPSLPKMPRGLPRGSFTSIRTLLLAAVMGIGTAVWAGNPEMEMTVKVGRGSGEDPMIVVWAETTDGDFVKTIHMFSKDKEYFKDMLAWRFKSNKKESKEQIDGVSGATIRWTKKKTIRFPVKIDGIDLLDGNYILRIESRQWKGKHFRNFEIPLPANYAGGVHEGQGYVKSVEIKRTETND